MPVPHPGRVWHPFAGPTGLTTATFTTPPLQPFAVSRVHEIVIVVAAPLAGFTATTVVGASEASSVARAVDAAETGEFKDVSLHTRFTRN